MVIMAGRIVCNKLLFRRRARADAKSGNIGRMAAQKDFNSVITEIKVFRLVIGRAELH